MYLFALLLLKVSCKKKFSEVKNLLQDYLDYLMSDSRFLVVIILLYLSKITDVM